MPTQPTEEEFLSRAVKLAVDNAAGGQLPFAALVVRQGDVLAVGVNTGVSLASLCVSPRRRVPVTTPAEFRL